MPVFRKYTDNNMQSLDINRTKRSNNKQIKHKALDLISVEDNLILLHLQHKAKQSAKTSMAYGMSEGVQIMYQRIYALNPQSYGGRIEHYIIQRLGLTKVKGDGDAIDANGKIYEIKGSMSDEGVFHMVQVRKHHKIDAYILVCVELLPEDNFRVIEHVFNIPAVAIHELNMELAHGRVENSHNNRDTENRKTIHKNDDLWHWLQKYRIEVKELI